MRKLFAVLIVVLIIVVGLIFALPSLINVNKYHDRIQAQLQQKLQRPVTLGDMRLKIVPFSIRVADAVIGEDPGFHTGRPFAAAQELAVSVKLLPLLRHQVEVNSVELLQPQVELVKNPQGIWNFASLGGPPKQSAARPAAKNSLSLRDLKITNAQVAVTDMQANQQRSLYDHIDLGLSNYASGQPFNLALTAHLPGQGNQTIGFDGKVGPMNAQNPAATPIDGKLKLNEVSLAGIEKYLNSPQLSQYDAVATGDATVRNENGKMYSAGSLQLQNVRIRGIDIGYPIRADYSASDDPNNNVINITKGNIKLGQTPFSITGTMESKTTPARVDMHLTASNASIAELAKLAASFGVAFNPGTQVTGKLNADITVRGALPQPAMNGTLHATNLVISGKDLPQQVSVDAVDLALTPDQVRSNQFTAQSGTTRLLTQFSLLHYTAPNSAIDAAVKTSGANLGEVLNIAKSYGVSAAEGMSGSGSLSLDARVQGPLKSPDQMIYSGTGSLQNAIINTPSLTKPLLIHNANLRFAQNSAVLENLQASLGSTNATGTATVKNFAAPQIQFALNADKLNITELNQITGSTTPPKRAANENPWSLVPAAYAQRNSASAISRLAGSGTLHVGSIIFDQLLLTNFQSNLKFSGNPAGNLMRTLNGDINFSTGNGKFQGVDLLHELASIGKFSQLGGVSKGFTNIVKLGGVVNIINGIANTNNLQAVIPGGTLGAAGTVDLVSEALNMHVNAVLDHAMSQQVGGTGIGGFMNTALANNKGELVLPVIVTGSVNHPAFAPDLQQLAQMKLNGLLPTTGNPSGLTSGIIGNLLGGKGAQSSGVGGILGALSGTQQNQQNNAQNKQQQQKQPPQQQNAVDQLLGILGKKKSK